MTPQRSMAWLAPLLFSGIMSSGCVAVDGGAVEVGWDLRFADGRRTDDNGDTIACGKVGFGGMRLSILEQEGGVDACADLEHCRFACSSQGVGTTDFQIAPGDYAIQLQVVDSAGQVLGPAEGVVTPGVVVRTISWGEITSLSVNLIIVDR